MIILFAILGIIGGVLIVLFIAAAFASEDYIVHSDIVIDKPVPDVFDYVKYLKNQAYYNKWVMIDPEVKKEFKGTDGTVGFFYSWDSKNNQVGAGEQIITGITPNKKVEYGLRFIRPFQGEAVSYIETDAVSSALTKVTWTFKGKRTYMMKVMHIAMNLPKMLTKDLSMSLGHLKTVLEK